MIHDPNSAKKMLLHLLDNAHLMRSNVDFSSDLSEMPKISFSLEFVLPLDFEYEKFHETMIEKKIGKTRFDNLDFE